MWCPEVKSVTGRAPLTPAVGAHVWTLRRDAHSRSQTFTQVESVVPRVPFDTPGSAHPCIMPSAHARESWWHFPLYSVSHNSPPWCSPMTRPLRSVTRRDRGGLLRRDITVLQPLKHPAYLLMRRDKQTEDDSESIYSSGNITIHVI